MLQHKTAHATDSTEGLKISATVKVKKIDLYMKKSRITSQCLTEKAENMISKNTGKRENNSEKGEYLKASVAAENSNKDPNLGASQPRINLEYNLGEKSLSS